MLIYQISPRDKKLLKAGYTKKDAEALCSIYKKYRDNLIIMAVTLCHDKNLAEDAVHDVFVDLAGSFANYDFNGNIKAYLSKCVANRVRDLLRKKQAKPFSQQEDYPTPVDLNEPGQLILCNEQLRMLSSVLAKLPYEQREVIVLHMQGELRFNSIAKSQGVSVNTVKGRYRYGIQKLRSILNGEL